MLVFGCKVIPLLITTCVRLQRLQSTKREWQSARPCFVFAVVVVVVHWLHEALGAPVRSAPCRQVISSPIISFRLLHSLTEDLNSVYLCRYWILHVVLILFQLLESLRWLLSDLPFVPCRYCHNWFVLERTWQSYELLIPWALCPKFQSNLQLSYKVRII